MVAWPAPTAVITPPAIDATAPLSVDHPAVDVRSLSDPSLSVTMADTLTCSPTFMVYWPSMAMPCAAMPTCVADGPEPEPEPVGEVGELASHAAPAIRQQHDRHSSEPSNNLAIHRCTPCQSAR